MSLRPPVTRERLLPNGRLDVLRQVALFGGAYLLYRLVEGAVAGSTAAAFANGRDLISLEQKLHVFVEPNIQAWAAGSHLLMEVATYIYINAQTTILIALLLYLYIAHNRNYYFVRNMLIVAMLIGLVGYALFPTAPPRFFPAWGFIDTISNVTHTSARNTLWNGFVNQYAAVPSMHVAFALMIGVTLSRLSRWRAAKIAWLMWPLLITFVTVITANHFLIDAVLGLLTAVAAAAVARRLARARPHVWAFYHPSPSPSRARIAVT